MTFEAVTEMLTETVRARLTRVALLPGDPYEPAEVAPN